MGTGTRDAPRKAVVGSIITSKMQQWLLLGIRRPDLRKRTKETYVFGRGVVMGLAGDYDM